MAVAPRHRRNGATLFETATNTGPADHAPRGVVASACFPRASGRIVPAQLSICPFRA